MAEASPSVAFSPGQPERRKRPPVSLTAIVIGAGLSGLLAGIRLKRAGIHSFIILDKAGDLGGTWLHNHYPGAACDVPSHLYSYSFAPNPYWRHHFPRQPDILGYLRKVSQDQGLTPHLAFNTEIEGATFDEATGKWTVRAANGRQWRARLLIAAAGQLDQPLIPDIPGRETFAGPQFHSARWDEGIDLRSKRVAVIGNGASAVQFVPEIASLVERLTIVQRSPHWIMPRPDRAIGRRAQALFRAVPTAQRLLRLAIWSVAEARWRAFIDPESWIARRLTRTARAHLEAQIAVPELRAKLTPHYPIGCKCLLFSSDYYPTLARANVELVTDGIARIAADGLHTEDGRHIPCDLIIWGTGFATARPLSSMTLEGLNGRMLADAWAEDPQAHRGVTVAGFPNFILLYGPNTNLGHNSVIYMVERQMDYAMQLIETLLKRDLLYLDVRPEAQAVYNHQLQQALGRTVWAAGCQSWYKQGSRITTNWSSSATRYGRQMRRLDIEAYRLIPRPVPATSA